MTSPMSYVYSLPTPSFYPSATPPPPSTPTPRSRQTPLSVAYVANTGKTGPNGKPTSRDRQESPKTLLSGRLPHSLSAIRLQGRSRSPSRARERQSIEDSRSARFSLDMDKVLLIPESHSRTKTYGVEHQSRISVALHRALSSPSIEMKKRLEHRLKRIRRSPLSQKSNKHSLPDENALCSDTSDSQSIDWLTPSPSSRASTRQEEGLGLQQQGSRELPVQGFEKLTISTENKSEMPSHDTIRQSREYSRTLIPAPLIGRRPCANTISRESTTSFGTFHTAQDLSPQQTVSVARQAPPDSAQDLACSMNPHNVNGSKDILAISAPDCDRTSPSSLNRTGTPIEPKATSKTVRMPLMQEMTIPCVSRNELTFRKSDRTIGAKVNIHGSSLSLSVPVRVRRPVEKSTHRAPRTLRMTASLPVSLRSLEVGGCKRPQQDTPISTLTFYRSPRLLTLEKKPSPTKDATANRKSESPPSIALVRSNHASTASSDGSTKEHQNLHQVYPPAHNAQLPCSHKSSTSVPLPNSESSKLSRRERDEQAKEVLEARRQRNEQKKKPRRKCGGFLMKLGNIFRA